MERIGDRLVSSSHETQIVEWRRRRLLEAGFGVLAAQDLARRRDVDLHELLGLVDRGCPPSLAVRIVG